jgi:hypothetical protein
LCFLSEKYKEKYTKITSEKTLQLAVIKRLVERNTSDKPNKEIKKLGVKDFMTGNMDAIKEVINPDLSIET